MDSSTIDSLDPKKSFLVPGVVVWARLSNMSSWPGVITQTKKKEGSENTRHIQFFSSKKKHGDVNLCDIREYSAHMHFMLQRLRYRGDVTLACEKADEHIFENGPSFQRDARREAKRRAREREKSDSTTTTTPDKSSTYIVKKCSENGRI